MTGDAVLMAECIYQGAGEVCGCFRVLLQVGADWWT